MKHLLVTNDFPPKVGGIQNYLWELWRRMDPETFCVLTTPHAGAEHFDNAQSYRVVRDKSSWLLPTRSMVRRINSLAEEVGAELVILDPAVPVGICGPRLDRPYGLILHGAEAVIPGRLPISKQVLRQTLSRASIVVAAGQYVADAAEGVVSHNGAQSLPTIVIPPGVDTDRFHPLAGDEIKSARHRLGLNEDSQIVLSVSRLVRRKGMDVLIKAFGAIQDEFPDAELIIAGRGRDEARLKKTIGDVRARAKLIGRIDDDDLPALYASADVFAMICQTRWGGLEQEGFGIVYLEAAACGVAQVAGRSGGAHEAVDDTCTGLIADDPANVAEVSRLLARMLGDPKASQAMGAAARERAEARFSYDLLAAELGLGISRALD